MTLEISVILFFVMLFLMNLAITINNNRIRNLRDEIKELKTKLRKMEKELENIKTSNSKEETKPKFEVVKPSNNDGWQM